MDIVSFETAKRLRDAGFPQPSARFGQFWYDETSESTNCIGFEDFSIWFEDLALEGYVFAPTATDILRRLPGHDFYFDGEHFAFSGDMQQGGENPAEVAAKKWLP